MLEIFEILKWNNLDLWVFELVKCEDKIKTLLEVS